MATPSTQSSTKSQEKLPKENKEKTLFKWWWLELSQRL
jgi:hypothetical protein